MAVALHWAMALLVIAAWLLGTFGDALPRGTARASGLFVHMTAGLAILALLLARIGWRASDPPPLSEPTRLGVWGERASRVAHYALYVLLALVPVLGIVVQFARGRGVPVFGMFEIASPWPADRTFARAVREVHEFAANALVTIAALHAGAALVHHWVFRDRTLARMLPWSGRQGLG